MKTLLITLLISGSVLTLKAQPKEKRIINQETTTVSITNTNDRYSLSAAFGKNKTGKIKELLLKELGTPAESDRNMSFWKTKNAYMVSLKIQKLNIELDKDEASPALIKKFEHVGKEIQKSLNNTRAEPSDTQN